MSTITARWPLPTLLASARRVGVVGTVLARGEAVVMQALCDLVPHGAAAGAVTQQQVADVAGFTREWTGVLMRRLVEGGWITYVNGTPNGGDDAAATPGHVVVNKRRLVEVIKACRPVQAAKAAADAAARAARMAAYSGGVLANNRRRRGKTPGGSMRSHFPPPPPTGGVTNPNPSETPPPRHWRDPLPGAVPMPSNFGALVAEAAAR